MSVQTMQPVQQSMDSLLSTTAAESAVTKSIPKLTMDEIRTKAFIGKGSFSKVYEVECKQPHQRSSGLPMSTLAFAMKCLDPKQVGKCPVKKEIATQDIEYESNILSQLDHPNIVKLHAVSPPQNEERQLPKRQSSSLSASSASSLSSFSSLASSSSHRRSRSSSKSRSMKGTIGKYLVLELLEDTLAERLKRWRFQKRNNDGMKSSSRNNSIPLQRRYSNGKKTISRVLNRSMSFRTSRSVNNLADLGSSAHSSSDPAAAAAAASNTSSDAADLLVRSEVVRSSRRRSNSGKSLFGDRRQQTSSASSSLSTSCHARLAPLTSDSSTTVNSLESIEDDESEQQLDRIRQVMPGLVSAMVYLHDKDLVFRDIKPQNVGFRTSKSNSKVKLFDFGLCRQTNECSDDEIVGTFRYMAPERMVFRRKSLIRRSVSDLSVMVDEPSDDELKMPSPSSPTSDQPQNEPVMTEADIRKSNMLKAADVYGIGVLMWEVATLERPYEELLSQKNMMRSDLHVKLHRQGWRHSTEQICCPKLRSLIEQCWNVDPAERPTMYEVSEILDDMFC